MNAKQHWDKIERQALQSFHSGKEGIRDGGFLYAYHRERLYDTNTSLHWVTCARVIMWHALIEEDRTDPKLALRIGRIWARCNDRVLPKLTREGYEHYQIYDAEELPGSFTFRTRNQSGLEYIYCQGIVVWSRLCVG